MTANDTVKRDTPPKNDAAPISANAPGSTQSFGTCVLLATKVNVNWPINLPRELPINNIGTTRPLDTLEPAVYAANGKYISRKTNKTPG